MITMPTDKQKLMAFHKWLIGKGLSTEGVNHYKVVDEFMMEYAHELVEEEFKKLARRGSTR